MVNKTERINKHGNCPKCGISWDGGPIPLNIRKHYNKPYKWSKLIGMEYPGLRDGVYEWVCPRCGERFKR